jgi:hypothetical protein
MAWHGRRSRVAVLCNAAWPCGGPAGRRGGGCRCPSGCRCVGPAGERAGAWAAAPITPSCPAPDPALHRALARAGRLGAHAVGALQRMHGGRAADARHAAVRGPQRQRAALRCGPSEPRPCPPRRPPACVSRASPKAHATPGTKSACTGAALCARSGAQPGPLRLLPRQLLAAAVGAAGGGRARPGRHPIRGPGGWGGRAAGSQRTAGPPDTANQP